MKKFLILLLSLVPLLCFSGAANALPTTWTDVHNTSQLMNYSNDHYITNDGFDPGIDLVLKWDFKLSFTDDKDWYQWEWAIVDLPGLVTDKFFEVSFNETIYTGFSVARTLSLNANDILGIDIYRAAGDFIFNGSTLNAYGNSDHFGSGGGNIYPVPEPANMLLLGTGLICIAAISRQKIFIKR